MLFSSCGVWKRKIHHEEVMDGGVEILRCSRAQTGLMNSSSIEPCYVWWN